MDAEQARIDEWLRQSKAGDPQAIQRLFAAHRDRLKRMICIRLDRRLAARVDPSDIVQETLAEAANRLPDYFAAQQIPFYPWLRQIASDRLAKTRARHLHAERRAIGREEPSPTALSDESVLELAERLTTQGASPSEHLVREELRVRVRAAIAMLSEVDQEILVLRYLEQLSASEARAVLGLGQEAFAKRHLRAIQRLRKLLGEGNDGHE